MSLRRVCALAVVATLGYAGVAWGVAANLDDVDLTADGGDATFQYGFDYGCADGTSGSRGDVVYSVEEGSLAVPLQSDAFDGALSLYVGDDPFTVPGEMVNVNAASTQVSSPNRTIKGVKVRRQGRSFPGSPTLRELIRFKNTTRKSITRSVTFATEYGSDDLTRVEETSSGDTRFNSRDRWGITGGASDPIVTTVHYGKGPVLKPFQQIGPYSSPDGGITDGADCAITSFRLKLRPKQTAFLMLFLEMHHTEAAAIGDAGKFNRPGLNATLRSGLSNATRAKIRNWDLG